MARLCAVEGGFALVRAAQQGVVTVSDGYGRARLAVSTSSAAAVLEVVSVASGPGVTLYARVGDWFGCTCVVGAALLLLAVGVWSGRAPTDSDRAKMSTARGVI